MRRKISRNSKLSKLITIIVGLFFLFMLITITQNENFKLLMSLSGDSFSQTFYIACSIGILIPAIIYFLLSRAKTLEFDNNFMYVIGRKEEEKIELKDVVEIKKSTIVINGENKWEISYYNKMREIKSIKILPNFSNTNFDEFKTLVEKEK